MGLDARHAKLAPFRASRWGPGACPGSPAMEEKYPESEEGEESRQGTAAHYYVTEALASRDHAPGHLTPNGYPIDVEMIECGAALLTDMRDTLKAAQSGALRIEERVSMARMVHPDNWGTPDVYLLDTAQTTLHVWDYKYGHRYVDAFKNWQMLDYAIGILECEGIADWHPWRITLTIAQPRNYAPEGPMREWYLSGSQLREYAGQLHEAAILAAQPDAPLQTGPHCQDCLAAHACPALQRAAMTAVDVSYKQGSIDMPADAVGLELRILAAGAARLKARMDALEEHAIGLVKGGANVPHWTMGRTQPRSKFIYPPEQVIAMGRLTADVDLTAPLATLTPSQAVKAGVDPSVVGAYSETPLGSLKLVALDDTAAARAFGGS